MYSKRMMINRQARVEKQIRELQYKSDNSNTLTTAKSQKRREFTSMEKAAIKNRHNNGASKTQLAKDFNTTVYQINKYT